MTDTTFGSAAEATARFRIRETRDRALLHSYCAEDPALAAYAGRCCVRPKVLEAMRAEGMGG